MYDELSTKMLIIQQHGHGAFSTHSNAHRQLVFVRDLWWLVRRNPNRNSNVPGAEFSLMCEDVALTKGSEWLHTALIDLLKGCSHRCSTEMR